MEQKQKFEVICDEKTNLIPNENFWITVKSRAVDRSIIQFTTLLAEGHST